MNTTTTCTNKAYNLYEILHFSDLEKLHHIIVEWNRRQMDIDGTVYDYTDMELSFSGTLQEFEKQYSAENEYFHNKIENITMQNVRKFNFMNSGKERFLYIDIVE